MYFFYFILKVLILFIIVINHQDKNVYFLFKCLFLSYNIEFHTICFRLLRNCSVNVFKTKHFSNWTVTTGVIEPFYRIIICVQFVKRLGALILGGWCNKDPDFLPLYQTLFRRIFVQLRNSHSIFVKHYHYISRRHR